VEAPAANGHANVPVVDKGKGPALPAPVDKGKGIAMNGAPDKGKAAAVNGVSKGKGVANGVHQNGYALWFTCQFLAVI
jgi:hypothetical protein